MKAVASSWGMYISRGAAPKGDGRFCAALPSTSVKAARSAQECLWPLRQSRFWQARPQYLRGGRFDVGGREAGGRAAAHQAWPQRAHCSFAWATPQASQTGIGLCVRGAARPGAGPATEEAQVAARARAENGGRCKKWNSDGVVCCVWGCPAEILLQSAQILLQSKGFGFR